MKKTELMCEMLQEVSEITEIGTDDILSNNKSEEIVDARHLLIMLLYDSGLYPSAIAQMIHCTKRNVNGVICNFIERCQRRKILRSNYEIIRNRKRNNSL